MSTHAQPDSNACPKCNGTGRFVTFAGRDHGACYPCKGTGRYQPPTPRAPTNATPLDLTHITAAFALAARTDPHARLRFAGLTISHAPPEGRNPGALYIKAARTYLGKVANGAFIRAHECTPDDLATIQGLFSDPYAAAIAYGRRTGRCAVCNRLLSDDTSIAAGIGPVCASKFGWTR